MKPKDLKFPFKFEERKPTLINGVFFVPKYYKEHSPSLFPSFASLFGNNNPIKIEFCSGNGSWIAEKAKNDPECNYVAIEMRFDRGRKIWSKMINYGLKNLFIVIGEGFTFAQNYLASEIASEIFINFPDPHPKRRHAKHRLIQTDFIKELSRILKTDGKFTFVTDDASYLGETFSLFKENASFREGTLFEEIEGYGTSFFDALWRSKGRKIFYFQCRRAL